MPVVSARFSRLPYVAMTVGVGLVAVVAYSAARYPLNGLIIGTVLLVAVVMVRQLVTQHGKRAAPRPHDHPHLHRHPHRAHEQANLL